MDDVEPGGDPVRSDGGGDRGDGGSGGVDRRPPRPGDLDVGFEDVGYVVPDGYFPWRGSSADGDLADGDDGSLGGLGASRRGGDAARVGERLLPDGTLPVLPR